MVVVLVVALLAAVGLGAALLVVRADLRATRGRLGEQEERAGELRAELSRAEDRAAAAEAERDRQADTARTAADRATAAGVELDRAKAARGDAEEQLRRVRAERDELDRRYRLGDDRLALALWALELARSDREWRVLAGPGDPAGGLAATGAREPGPALADALRRQLERFREEIGVPTDFSGSVDRAVPASLAMLGLRATEELVAAAARNCEGVAVEVAADDDRLAIVVHCDRLQGGSDQLPLATLRDALTNRGGNLQVAEGDEARVVSVEVSLPLA